MDEWREGGREGDNELTSKREGYAHRPSSKLGTITMLMIISSTIWRLELTHKVQETSLTLVFNTCGPIWKVERTLQRSAKVGAPGCVNAAGKLGQK